MSEIGMNAFFSSDKYVMRPLSPEAVTHIFGSTAFHTVLFFVFYALSSVIFSTFKTLEFYKKIDWVSRLVSNFHAIVSFGGALYAILSHSCYLTLDISCYDNGIGELTLRYTIGYFCYDLLLIFAFYKKIGSIGMVLHHLFGILGWGLILSYGSFSFIALTFTLTEATTPFVNQRWFLHECKMKETKLYAMFGFLLWLSWSIVRVPLVPLTGYYLFLNIEEFKLAPPSVVIVCNFNYILISCLNSYWYYLISKGLVSVLFGSSKKKDTKKKEE